MIPLSRVEKEHIFSIFYEEKPNLYLVSKGKKQCFSASHYINENGTVKITDDLSQFINAQKIFAFFFHKRVKIYFPIVLQKSFSFESLIEWFSIDSFLSSKRMPKISSSFISS